MQYKLYDSKKESSNVLKQILYNRGIDNVDTYLNLNKDVVSDYNLIENMEEAVFLFDKHFKEKNCIGIIPDSDVDGQCSSAEVYLYIKRMDVNYPIKIIYHTRPKAHGLSDVEIPNDVKLLIIADAGTNDTSECKKLKDRGIDVLILDHHEKEKDNPYALIVNNQCSDKYSNKQLCGGGIVYRWLQALDDYYWNEFADDYLDLVAFANISDVMDLRELETRYLVNCGLLNIQNKFLKALIQSQDYSMNGKINIHNVQWYLTPVVNAILRVGSQEEKELLFRAFIENDEFFEYKKRGITNKAGQTVKESIYDRAARLCKNAKSKQDRKKEKSLKAITEIINNEQNNNKVILVDTTGILDTGLTGVVAIKVAELYNKPCVLLNRFFDPVKNRNMYIGSARNVNNSPIDSFKDIINTTKAFDFGQGHANAFGVRLEIDKKDTALEELNNILKDVVYDSTYKVDFILNPSDINIEIIYEMNKFEDLICQGIEPPMIAVIDITLSKNDFEIFGKNEDTISFVLNEIKYVQFKCKEGNPLYDWIQNAWDENEEITFEIVGKPTINDYNGLRTPQIIIEDVNVINTAESDMIFDEDFEYEVWEKETDW